MIIKIRNVVISLSILLLISGWLVMPLFNSAKSELKKVLNTRQEARLVLMGMLN